MPAPPEWHDCRILQRRRCRSCVHLWSVVRAVVLCVGFVMCYPRIHTYKSCECVEGHNSTFGNLMKRASSSCLIKCFYRARGNKEQRCENSDSSAVHSPRNQSPTQVNGAIPISIPIELSKEIAMQITVHNTQKLLPTLHRIYTESIHNSNNKIQFKVGLRCVHIWAAKVTASQAQQLNNHNMTRSQDP